MFAKLDGAPQVKVILPNRDSPQYRKAVDKRSEALAMYAYYRGIYGMDAQWLDPEIIYTPEDTDWPEWSANET